jgi:hypothetical protein
MTRTTTIRRPGHVLGATAATTLLGAATVVMSPPTSAAPPSHDDFGQAQVITAYGVHTTDNSEATLEPGEPLPSCAFTGQGPGPHTEGSLWYAFTAPSSEDVTLSTEGSASTDTQLAVYTGTSLVDLDEVGCNEDVRDTDLRSQVSLEMTAGTTYWVQVATWTDGDTQHFRGGLELDVTGPPGNDDLAQAREIVGSGAWLTSNVGATLEPGEPLPSCADASVGPGPHSEDTVWFAYQALTSGPVYLDTFDSPSPDTQLAVYEGAAIDELVEVACGENDGGPGSRHGLVGFEAVAGVVYRVQLATWTDGASGGSPGGITLQAAELPPDFDGDVRVAGQGRKAPGAALELEVRVRTDNSGGARPGDLSVRLPTSLRARSVSSDDLSCQVGQVITCAVPRLAVAQQVTVTVRVAPRSEGPFSFGATWSQGWGAREIGRAGAGVGDDPTNNDVSTRIPSAVVCDGPLTGRDTVLRGSRRGDVLCGQGGNDVLQGRGGADVMFGGRGRDTLVGGPGRDFLVGGGGDDSCRDASDVQRSC